MPAKGEPTQFGSRCPSGCALATIVVGFFSVPYTVVSLASGPRKLARSTNKVWSWVGVGFGTTLLAIGTTHAIINRDELASAAIVPLAVGGPTGAAALAVGIAGLTAGAEPDTTTPAAIACRGTRCRFGIPAPQVTADAATLTLASGRF